MKIHTAAYKRWILMPLILWCGCNICFAQKSDYTWLQGYQSWAHVDDSDFGNTVMNFNYNPVQIAFDSLSMNFDCTNTSFCDSNGVLLFYSNGIYIANNLNEKIANSDSLNAGWLQYVWDTSITDLGYRNTQGILAFQNIANPNQYYLVYSYTDSIPGSQGTNLWDPDVLSALIDMSANAGLGKVIYKNVPLINSNVGDELAAVKHGNGRDWWIVSQKRNTNCYYLILDDSLGPHLQDSVCMGRPIPENDGGSISFSTDGSKMAFFDVAGGINIFDFDRCTGTISNPTFIPLPIWADSSWLGNGVAFSPNSRFLYVSATKIMLQYDMWASDIPASVDTIGIYDGYTSPSSFLASLFNTAQLAPDGKIYISCGNTVPIYHVINNPDQPGTACNFEQHAVSLPTFSVSVPTYPNYRLGALTQSQCDTLGLLSDIQRAAKEQIIKVYPNPAQDYAIIDYGFTDWSKAQPNLEVCNTLGQTVYTQQLPMYSGLQKIDITPFASGMYTVYIKRNNAVIASSKLVKQ